MSDIIRVVRIIEYIGPRELVEPAVEDSIHGVKKLPGGLQITVATIGPYPEILFKGLKLSSAEWLSRPEYEGVMILDPDGWDRSNFEESWEEKISKKEFDERLAESTSILR